MAQNIIYSPWGVIKGPWLFFNDETIIFCPVCFPCISFLLLCSNSPQYSSLNQCSFISSLFRNPAWHDLVLFSGYQMAKIKVSAALSFHLGGSEGKSTFKHIYVAEFNFVQPQDWIPLFLFAWPLHLHVSNGASNSFSALNLWLPFLLLAREKLSAFTEFMVRSGPPG